MSISNIFQAGHWRAEVPFNSSYWAPFDAHDPVLLQEILLGLTRTPAEKADLAMAENIKICKSLASLKLSSAIYIRQCYIGKYKK